MSDLTRLRFSMALHAASVVAILTGLVLMWRGHYQGSTLALIAALNLDPWWLERTPKLKENQAIVTAPVEPSADIRQFVSVVSQVRTGFLNEGYTAEETNELLGRWITAATKGDQ